ncbi:MAG: hypothetical protein ACI4VG_02050 [Lachnospiraceae bacterium]
MIGYPLDSHISFDKNGIPVYDRAITSAPLRKLTKALFSDGVLPNPSTNLQVIADGEKIKIKAGFALCDGCQKLQEEDLSLFLPAADGTNSRIDTVVLRLNNNEDVRECEFHVISGIAAASPVRPQLTRTESIWEIGLADIRRKSNSTEVTTSDIADTRYETSRCGIISSISRFDTTTLYQQVQDDLNQFRNVSQEEFNIWFEIMRDKLSEDAAGSLQSQIGILEGLITSNKDNLVNAINDVAQRILGFDVLDTVEEIEANTSPGIAAGALALKATKNIFGGISQFFVDPSSGEITGYTTEIGGADTVFPFKRYTIADYVHTSEEPSIILAKKPSWIFAFTYPFTGAYRCIAIYCNDGSNSFSYGYRHGSSSTNLGAQSDAIVLSGYLPSEGRLYLVYTNKAVSSKNYYNNKTIRYVIIW